VLILRTEYIPVSVEMSSLSIAMKVHSIFSPIVDNMLLTPTRIYGIYIVAGEVISEAITQGDADHDVSALLPVLRFFVKGATNATSLVHRRMQEGLNYSARLSVLRRKLDLLSE
jgi:hypothetical protein